MASRRSTDALDGSWVVEDHDEEDATSTSSADSRESHMQDAEQQTPKHSLSSKQKKTAHTRSARDEKAPQDIEGSQRSEQFNRSRPGRVGRRGKPATKQATKKLPEISPEPEFFMPPLDRDTMEASWAESPDRTTRHRRNLDDSALRNRKHNLPLNDEPRTSATDFASDHRRSQPRPLNVVSGPSFVDVVSSQLLNILSHSLDILGRALRLLKTPISIILAIWLLFGAGVVLRNMLTSSIYASLTPLCRIPGLATTFGLPFCPQSTRSPDYGYVPPVEFDELMSVQSKFEDVLTETAGGVSLPVEMKRSETSIRDLRQLVTYSTVPSKNELVMEFDGFIETSRIASYDLQKFNSHVGRAVDNIMSTTRWTLRVLDDMQLRKASQSTIGSFVNNQVFAIFQPIQFSESKLVDQYIIHAEIIEEEIHKLIFEAQALLGVLNNLEDRLDVIHGIVTRDNHSARARKEEILSELWTIVGGNRGKLSSMNRQLNLLQQVGIYRKTAYAHVSGALVRLQEIGAGLEDLRERVAAPALLQDRIEVPLALHIENIQRGVDRLEDGRDSARRVENEQIKQSVERGISSGNLIDG